MFGYVNVSSFHHQICLHPFHIPCPYMCHSVVMSTKLGLCQLSIDHVHAKVWSCKSKEKTTMASSFMIKVRAKVSSVTYPTQYTCHAPNSISVSFSSVLSALKMFPSFCVYFVLKHDVIKCHTLACMHMVYLAVLLLITSIGTCPTCRDYLQ